MTSCNTASVGWMLLHRVGTEKDEAAAKTWFEKASRLGNPHAQYRLAKIILAAPGSSPEQRNDAIHWLTRSAEGENDFAQYTLGKLLLEKGDTENGVRWLTASAEQGNPFAQYALGKLYLLGKENEIERNWETAVYWLTLAANQGNQYAQYFLIHLDDFRQRLMAQGVTRILNHLGNLLQEQLPPSPGGLRVKVDHKLKRKLQEKKAAQGHKQDDHEPVMTS